MLESERGCLLLVQKEKTTEGVVESQGGALREVVLGGFSCRGAGLQLIQQADNRSQMWTTSTDADLRILSLDTLIPPTCDCASDDLFHKRRRVASESNFPAFWIDRAPRACARWSMH